MAKNVDKIAERLGAEVRGDVPDAGGGAFGAMRVARLVAELRARLEPGRGQRPGRPTDPGWVHHPKVPMSEATRRKLDRLAREASGPERKVTAMQVAAQLLEEALAGLPEG